MDVLQTVAQFAGIFMDGFMVALTKAYELLGIAGIAGFLFGYIISDKLGSLKTTAMILGVVLLIASLYFGYMDSQSATNAIQNTIQQNMSANFTQNSTNYIPYG